MPATKTHQHAPYTKAEYDYLYSWAKTVPYLTTNKKNKKNKNPVNPRDIAGNAAAAEDEEEEVEEEEEEERGRSEIAPISQSESYK